MYDLEVNTQYNIENYKLNYRACIPFYILLDKDLSRNELVLYGLIEQMENSKGIVFYNNRKIAEILGVNHESRIVGKMIKKLKDKGLIERVERDVIFKRKNGQEYKETRWCFSTIKAPVVDTSDLDDKGVVSEVPSPLVSEVPSPLVSEVPPYNTHKSNTHNNNSILSISTKCTKNKSNKKYQKDDRFMKFYNSYPKHEKPNDAYKAFKSVVGNDEELLKTILADISLRIKRHTQWQDKKYIPLPATYLRSACYEGEIYNEAEEREKQAKIKQQEADKRLKEQEQFSQQQAENELNKQRDAQVYRKTTDAIRSAPPKSFTELKEKLKI